MGRDTGTQKPGFFWHGFLIVLPVVLLAAVGFISMRQDRLLARQEAIERAQRLADDLLNKYWSVLNFRQDPGLIQLYPVLSQNLGIPTNRPPYTFEVDAQGKLLFPPPATGLPVPCQFDLQRLSSEQLRLWHLARTPEAGKKEAALARWNDFLALKPPPDFAAAALYSLGLAFAQAGNTIDAVAQFRALADNYPNALGESGLPLLPLAQLKLMELAGTNSSGEIPNQVFEQFCSNVVCRPTLLTPQFLDTAAERAGVTQQKETVKRWKAVWEEHEWSRLLYDAARPDLIGPLQRNDLLLADSPTSLAAMFWFVTPTAYHHSLTNRSGTFRIPFEWEDRNWLAVKLPQTSSNSWYLCQPESELGFLASELTDQMPFIPDYLGVGINIAGQPLRVLAPDLRVWQMVHYVGGKGAGQDAKEFQTTLATDVLASATKTDAGGASLSIKVFLRSPSVLYQRQKARTFWFGLLIATAAGAALVGLAAAYRSFYRQLRLSELKSNFVSSVSHELRSPLASVRLLAESLDRGKVPDSSKQQEYFRFIVQECRRLSGLIENVLDFSRIDQGRKQYEFEPTDVVALVRRTVQLMQTYAAERDAQLHLSLDEQQVAGFSHEFNLDGKAIQQALINLIDNALKHSPKGVSVRVGLEKAPKFQPRGIHALSSNLHSSSAGVLRIWVEDNGPGIPKSEQQKIFERFYRLGSELRRETTGVGIGLSIVKHVVEAHGGQVLVRSEVGHGSCFTIELPISRDIGESGNDVRKSDYGTHSGC